MKSSAQKQNNNQIKGQRYTLEASEEQIQFHEINPKVHNFSISEKEYEMSPEQIIKAKNILNAKENSNYIQNYQPEMQKSKIQELNISDYTSQKENINICLDSELIHLQREVQKYKQQIHLYQEQVNYLNSKNQELQCYQQIAECVQTTMKQLKLKNSKKLNESLDKLPENSKPQYITEKEVKQINSLLKRVIQDLQTDGKEQEKNTFKEKQGSNDVNFSDVFRDTNFKENRQTCYYQDQQTHEQLQVIQQEKVELQIQLSMLSENNAALQKKLSFYRQQENSQNMQRIEHVLGLVLKVQLKRLHCCNLEQTIVLKTHFHDKWSKLNYYIEQIEQTITKLQRDQFLFSQIQKYCHLIELYKQFQNSKKLAQAVEVHINKMSGQFEANRNNLVNLLSEKLQQNGLSVNKFLQLFPRTSSSLCSKTNKKLPDFTFLIY